MTFAQPPVRIGCWLVGLLFASWALYAGLPRFAFWWVEHELNEFYRYNRPDVYRWEGAPNGPVRTSAGRLGRRVPLLRILASTEAVFGRNARSLTLTGRINGLSGNWEVAISALKVARVLDPQNAAVAAELGAAYARRAALEGRAIDYAAALDSALQATVLDADSSAAFFNAAAILGEFPLPEQADQFWAKALVRNSDSGWTSEIRQRHAAQAGQLAARQQDADRLVSHPSLHDLETRDGAAELVLATALDEWIADRNRHGAQLELLARALKEEYRDPWLNDLLRLPVTPAANAALTSLSEAWRHNSTGEHSRARENAGDAIQRFHQLGNLAGEARARLELILGLHRDGLSGPCLVESGKLPNLTAYPWLRGQAWLDRTICLGQERRFDVADERERAYQWIRTTRFRGLELRSLASLTEPEVGLANPLRVWDRSRKGLASYWASVLPPLRVHPIYYSLAESCAAWGYPFAAVAMARESTMALRKTPHRRLTGLVLARLGSLETAAGLTIAAADTFRQASDMFSGNDSDQSGLLQGLAQIQIAVGESRSGRPEAAISRLRHLKALHYGSYGDFYFRPALGTALLAAGRLSEAVSEFRTAISENQLYLREVTDPAQREASQRDLAESFRGLTQAQLMQGDSQGALRTWLQFRGGARAEGPVSPAAKVQTAMLVSAFLPKGLTVWFVSSAGIQQRWLNAAFTESMSRMLIEGAGKPTEPVPLIDEAARRLYSELLLPFEASLSGIHTLVIEADGPLAQLPWPILRNTAGRRLVEQFGLVQIKGLPASLAPFRVERRKALILSDPDLGPELSQDFPPLREARREADFLHGLLPVSTLLEGKAVTLPAFAAATREQSIIHFSGHGISHGGFGAILLAGATTASGEIVTAEKIKRMDLSGVDLVFLSACSTGAGESTASADLESLVNGFLQAGAARVIATRWSVDALSSRILVEKFYEAIYKNIPPAEALRRAMVAISQMPEFAQPHYWAGFQLFGTM